MSYKIRRSSASGVQERLRLRAINQVREYSGNTCTTCEHEHNSSRQLNLIYIIGQHGLVAFDYVTPFLGYGCRVGTGERQVSTCRHVFFYPHGNERCVELC